MDITGIVKVNRIQQHVYHWYGYGVQISLEVCDVEGCMDSVSHYKYKTGEAYQI